MDAGFYSADYLRAWIRSAQLRAYLRREVATTGGGTRRRARSSAGSSARAPGRRRRRSPSGSGSTFALTAEPDALEAPTLNALLADELLQAPERRAIGTERAEPVEQGDDLVPSGGPLAESESWRWRFSGAAAGRSMNGFTSAVGGRHTPRRARGRPRGSGARSPELRRDPRRRFPLEALEERVERPDLAQRALLARGRYGIFSLTIDA